MTELDLPSGDGILHAYDAGGAGGDLLPVLWFHGTPGVGAPPAPLLALAGRLRLRWVGYDRPGYGGSTARPDRDAASAASDAARVADALGLTRFAVVGYSGGGPHALACAAQLSGRVVAAVSAGGLAPFGAAGLDWFAGMCASGRASLRAAAAGREAKERHERSGVDYDPEFVPSDHAAFAEGWGCLGDLVKLGQTHGPGPLIDDDLAYVRPWGFDPARIAVPVLVLHGTQDRVVPAAHGAWLAQRCSTAELRLFPDAGHVSVLRGVAAALEWVRALDAGVGSL
jgi:pimeloyl-ACP methyl ester carboxylesterase